MFPPRSQFLLLAPLLVCGVGVFSPHSSSPTKRIQPVDGVEAAPSDRKPASFVERFLPGFLRWKWGGDSAKAPPPPDKPDEGPPKGLPRMARGDDPIPARGGGDEEPASFVEEAPPPPDKPGEGPPPGLPRMARGEDPVRGGGDEEPASFVEDEAPPPPPIPDEEPVSLVEDEAPPPPPPPIPDEEPVSLVEEERTEERTEAGEELAQQDAAHEVGGFVHQTSQEPITVMTKPTTHQHDHFSRHINTRSCFRCFLKGLHVERIPFFLSSRWNDLCGSRTEQCWNDPNTYDRKQRIEPLIGCSVLEMEGIPHINVAHAQNERIHHSAFIIRLDDNINITVSANSSGPPELVSCPLPHPLSEADYAKLRERHYAKLRELTLARLREQEAEMRDADVAWTTEDVEDLNIQRAPVTTGPDPEGPKPTGPVPRGPAYPDTYTDPKA